MFILPPQSCHPPVCTSLCCEAKPHHRPIRQRRLLRQRVTLPGVAACQLGSASQEAHKLSDKRILRVLLPIWPSFFWLKSVLHRRVASDPRKRCQGDAHDTHIPKALRLAIIAALRPSWASGSFTATSGSFLSLMPPPSSWPRLCQLSCHPKDAP